MLTRVLIWLGAVAVIASVWLELVIYADRYSPAPNHYFSQHHHRPL